MEVVNRLFKFEYNKELHTLEGQCYVCPSCGQHGLNGPQLEEALRKRLAAEEKLKNES